MVAAAQLDALAVALRARSPDEEPVAVEAGAEEVEEAVEVAPPYTVLVLRVSDVQKKCRRGFEEEEDAPWISERPTLAVVELTWVTVRRSEVVVTVTGSWTTNAEPSLTGLMKLMLEPSLAVSVPALSQSAELGRSYRTTVEIETAWGQVSLSHAPAPWWSDAHSADSLRG